MAWRQNVSTSSVALRGQRQVIAGDRRQIGADLSRGVERRAVARSLSKMGLQGCRGFRVVSLACVRQRVDIPFKMAGFHHLGTGVAISSQQEINVRGDLDVLPGEVRLVARVRTARSCSLIAFANGSRAARTAVVSSNQSRRSRRVL